MERNCGQRLQLEILSSPTSSFFDSACGPQAHDSLSICLPGMYGMPGERRKVPGFLCFRLLSGYKVCNVYTVTELEGGRDSQFPYPASPTFDSTFHPPGGGACWDMILLFSAHIFTVAQFLHTYMWSQAPS